MTDSTALIEALERAEGPSRELDCKITLAFGLHGGNPIIAPGVAGWLVGSETNPNPVKAPTFTASIDAALTLVPEGWPSRRVGSTDDGRGYAELAGHDGFMIAEDPDEFYVEGEASTPAIALVIAALRAKGAQS